MNPKHMESSDPSAVAVMPFVSGKTRLFAVIADPVAHVRAPMVLNPMFAENGIDAIMVPMQIPAVSLESTIRGLAAMPNMGGVAVTIPHKMALAELCDSLGLGARITGAVNAVRFDNGKLVGDNFDGTGFVAGLVGEGHDPAERSVLMIGAGGAARAIAVALLGRGISSLTISNRSPEKAETVAELLRQHRSDIPIRTSDTAMLSGDLKDFDLIINATSLGLHNGDALPCNLDRTADHVVVAEVIMIPDKTAWLEHAEAHGLVIHKGRHMFDYQSMLIGRFLGALPE